MSPEHTAPEVTDQEAEDATVATQPGSSHSVRIPISRAFPIAGWDRYEFVQFLGAGGMGRVFKARDTRLNRFVALKFLQSDDPELVRRLFREAQAQARIDHNHICKVYEVGEVEGRAYIAMQYIDGPSLREAKDAMTVDQKVEVIRQAAEALHAAHRVGLVHRDIKPANIMLEPSEKDGFRPYVMDFGLAREVHSHGQTLTGTIEGTPAYMAPEQARGELNRLDRRTDVYSLGATLYELLGGRPPFQGPSGLEIMLALVQQEPEPIGKLYAGVPADLETIVMKCLEKEQARRYESAKALADDLQRYLNGEPVDARRAGLGYLLLKKAKKHKVLVGLSIALLTCVLLLGGAWLQARQTAAEQADLAQRLGQDVKEMETYLRVTYLLPLHDTRLEKALIRERMARIKRQMEQVGSLGSGPGHYAIGKGYIALHEHEAALRHLDEAVRAGYATPEIHYAMGQAHGGIYAAAMEEALRIGAKEIREAKVREIERAHLEPALRHMKESGGANVESQPYTDGLSALFRKQHGEALGKARLAFEESPRLYEAKKLEGDAHFAQGNEAKEQGDYEETLRHYTMAVEAFKAASEIARSDPTIYDAEAATWVEFIEVARLIGRSPKDPLDRALAAIDKSLLAEPENGKAYRARALALLRFAMYELESNQDPSATLAGALAASRRAAELCADDALAHEIVGGTYVMRAQFELRSGKDPGPSLDRAAESHRRALELDPNLAWAWNDLAIVYTLKADYDAAHGAAPRESIERAVENYKRATELSPLYPYPYTNICFALSIGARFELEHGQDPRPLLRRAARACEQASQVNPNFPGPHTNLGIAHYVESEYSLVMGVDPAAAANRALESAAAALKISAGETLETSQYLSNVHRVMALYALEHGVDPALSLDNAEKEIDRGLAVAPSDATLHHRRGQVELVAARWRLLGGSDPKDVLDNAEAALEKAVKLDPNKADTYLTLAELSLRRVEWASRRKKPVLDDIARGLSAIEKALSIYPQMPRALGARGALYLTQARAERSPKARVDSARNAQVSFEAALRANALLQRELGALFEEAKQIASVMAGHVSPAPSFRPERLDIRHPTGLTEQEEEPP